ANVTAVNGANVPTAALFQLTGDNVAADTNSFFDGLVISNAAVGMLVSDCSPWISNCVFTANGTGLALQGNPLVAHCQFLGNLDHGITIEAGSPKILYSRISGNMGSGSTNAAVAIDTGGVSSPEIIYCLVTGNYGGAFSVTGGGGLPAIYNCTVAGNYSPQPGAGIYNRNTEFLVENSVIWDNGSATTEPPPAGELFSTVNGGIQSYYSDIDEPIPLSEVNSDADNNVIDFDPMFAGAASFAAAPTVAGDYHLESCSPAIALADFAINLSLNLPDPYYFPNPQNPTPLLTDDLDGNPNTIGSPGRSGIFGPWDAGTYEFQDSVQTKLVVYQPPTDTTNCVEETTQFTVYASINNGVSTNVAFQWQQS